MRKTKIVCTIGPASDSEEILREMCLAGMNVARLNFSHGTHEEQQKRVDMLKKVRQELNLPVAILLDTKGPEYRIKTFKKGPVTLNPGDTFTFTTEDIEGTKEKVSVSYKNLISDLVIGDIVLVNNGLVELKVKELTKTDAICEVIYGGEISDRKSMNFPGHRMTNDFLSEQDKKDLLFGIKNDVDFVAASFVSCKQDVCDLRDFLNKNGGSDIEIIAKIENQTGVNNIDEICEIADGIMIARGDLGVEIPFVKVPYVQKYLIQKCRLLGCRVITATEMLESMIHNPRPTRAEISDVANAVYDGTSALMLSGETAAGDFPVESLKAMSEAAEYTESNIDYETLFKRSDFSIKNNLDAVSHAAASMAVDLDAKCIVVNSISGITARMVSRFRCPTPILGMTTQEKVWRRLNLSWGVTPVLRERFESIEVMLYLGFKDTVEIMDLKPGDNVVLTGGKMDGNVGSTNTIRVSTV